jgi:parvulin-like peptidyl-prolyl isomerase
MLKVFRNKNTTKIVLWAILILILPSFVLWGTGNLGGGSKKGPTYAGKIENKKVSFDDFGESLMSIRCQIIFNYLDNQKALESLLKNKQFMGKLAWQRLLMISRARMARIKVSDQDIVKFISTHPLFVRGGKFDDRVYEYFLKNTLGLYPRNFEEIMRENLMIQKLTESITKDIKVTDEEIAKDYEKENSKFKISYILYPLTSFTDKTKVSDQEIKDFYEQNKQSFVIQEKKADGKEGAKRISTFDETKDMIKALLSEDRARPFAMDEANKTYDKINELMTKDKLTFDAAAAKLKLKIQESKTFTKSDSLEGIGEMAQVASVAANMKKGEISRPVETRNSVLIFAFEEKLPADQEKFKKDKEEFTKKMLTEKKNAYIENWLKELEKGAELKIDLNDYEKYYK